ncbi:hypothetical protein HYW21_07785 [Candidatus Woesearchaeota archaeon]|nr:hypothetical protein [Candidatus Woesearchaeota archaeon]
MAIPFEIRRRCFHIGYGLLIVLLLVTHILTPWRLVLLFAVGILLSILSHSIKLPLVYWFLKHFERPEVLEKFPGKGAMLFTLGCIIPLFLFSRDIALAAIMVLTLGDGVSHLVGKTWGKRNIPFNQAKRVEGSIAGMGAAFLGALFFVSPLEAFLASFVAMAVEAVEITFFRYDVDDNITVPLVASAVIFLLRNILKKALFS